MSGSSDRGAPWAAQGAPTTHIDDLIVKILLLRNLYRIRKDRRANGIPTTTVDRGISQVIDEIREGT